MQDPKYDKAAAKREKRRLKAIKLLNRICHPTGYGIFYRQGRWHFGRVFKPKTIHFTYYDAIRRWDLADEDASPLNENAIRRLLEGNVELKDKQKKSKWTKKRRYIPTDLGVEGLFDLLNQNGVRYAVLRWFDTLPDVKPGEDIDILFADEDMPLVDTLFLPHKRKGAVKCDIYSAGGLTGSSLDGLPYYEKRLAEQILDNTQMHADRFKVPDSWHYLLSLTYHVFYHKAHNSGLPSKKGVKPSKDKADHDYATILTGLAKENGVQLEPTLSGLYSFLKKHGWDASLDTARKLSLKRPGLLGYYPRQKRVTNSDGELSVFVVRKWAYDRNLLTWICQNLRNFGFDIKLVKELDKEEQERAASKIRGGNWGAGPRPVSGGPPAVLIAAYDYVPCPASQEMQMEHPHVTNARVVRAKDIFRKSLNAHVPKHLRTNPMHSADDEAEAWDYLESVIPDLVPEVRKSIGKGFQGDPYTRLLLLRGRRTYNYLVFRDGKPHVLKVFSEGKEGMRSRDKEMFAMEKFGKEPWTPDWVDYGPNWMMMKYYQQKRRVDYLAGVSDEEERRKMAGKVIDLLFDIYSKGYAHRDAHSLNVFYEKGQMKIIDFESMSEQDTSIPFLQSYDIKAKGSKSPNFTGKMCYTRNTGKKSFTRVLRVKLDEALKHASRKIR